MSAKVRVGVLNRLLFYSCSVCLLAIGCSPPQGANQEQAQKTNQQQPAQPQSQAAQSQDEEVQMGQEVFNELKAKGEIIESSPLYDQLRPISDAIACRSASGLASSSERSSTAMRCPLSLRVSIGRSAPDRVGQRSAPLLHSAA